MHKQHLQGSIEVSRQDARGLEMEFWPPDLESFGPTGCQSFWSSCEQAHFLAKVSLVQSDISHVMILA